MDAYFSILVVCYHCEIDQSRSITGVLKHVDGKCNVNVVIWNNGPIQWSSQSIDEIKSHSSNIIVVQTSENRPLSWIYNDFIEMYSSDYYVIFDHDSDVNFQFISNLFSLRKELLCLPIIYSKGVAVNPTCNGLFNSGPYMKNQKVMSIGSGLVLSKQLVNILHKRWGSVFDERFALYGVDTTFFKRINKLNSSDLIRTISGFEHSLSRSETESDRVQSMRRNERSIDLGLSLRLYPSFGLYWHLLKILVKESLGNDIVNFHIMMRSFFSARHPRTQQQRARQKNHDL